MIWRRTDRVSGAAENGSPIGNPNEENDAEKEQEWHRDVSSGQGDHGIGKIGVDVASRGGSEPEREAVVNCAGGQCRNDRLKPAIDNNGAVYCPA